MDKQSAENARRLGVTQENASKTTHSSAQLRPTPPDDVLREVTPIAPERRLKESGKHGLEWEGAVARAIKDQKPQGKWNRKQDLDYAGKVAATLQPNEDGIFALLSDSIALVYYPDGSASIATHMYVRNNGHGTFHAYPLRRTNND